MKQAKRLSVWAFGVILFFASCSKHDATTPTKVYKPLNDGLYISNEGLYPSGTASLTFYDSVSKQATTDIFENTNDSTLGIGGNGMIVYGSKLYVVVNGSNLIAVMNKRTAQLIKQIKGAKNWGPQYAVADNGQIYVSANDGTVSAIDTVSLSITKTCTVGVSPVGLAIANNKLYAANSGGVNYPNLDSTVSVVDLSSMKEIKKIKVGINPQKVVADSKGNIYVLVWGYSDYSSGSPIVVSPAKIYKIDANTQTVTDSTSDLSNSGKMAIYNDNLYLTGIDYNVAVVFPTSNLKANYTKFVTDGTSLDLPYGIDIDESNGDVYITDAIDYSSPGKVYCFDKAGKQKFSFTAGVVPDQVVFLR